MGRRRALRTLLTLLPVGLFALGCGGGVPFQGLAADEIYNLGVQAVERGDWGEAIKTLERALVTPGLTRPAQARVLLARAYFEEERYIEARAEYQRVLDRHSTDAAAVIEASLGVCRSAAALTLEPTRDQTQTRSAEAVCGQVARQFAGTPAGLEAERLRQEMYDKLAEADYLVGLHYFKREAYIPATEYFEAVVEDHPESKWVPWALYQLWRSFSRVGFESDAKQAKDRLLAEFPDSEPARRVAEGNAGG
ncbi:MAG: outer membrane protein assembly factor BamD [Gemmatimonadetes bacterium]|nr:MAG: outer membrane protein assembly factor BamD [Gemmatimonadota bacterium]